MTARNKTYTIEQRLYPFIMIALICLGMGCSHNLGRLRPMSEILQQEQTPIEISLWDCDDFDSAGKPVNPKMIHKIQQSENIHLMMLALDTLRMECCAACAVGNLICFSYPNGKTICTDISYDRPIFGNSFIDESGQLEQALSVAGVLPKSTSD